MVSGGYVYSVRTAGSDFASGRNPGRPPRHHARAGLRSACSLRRHADRFASCGGSKSRQRRGCHSGYRWRFEDGVFASGGQSGSARSAQQWSTRQSRRFTAVRRKGHHRRCCVWCRPAIDDSGKPVRLPRGESRRDLASLAHPAPPSPIVFARYTTTCAPHVAVSALSAAAHAPCRH
jgi:hypothetical protein